MSNKTGSTFLAFFIGLLAGGIIGLLFAPEKGSHTRDKLSFLLDKYKLQLEDLVKQVSEGKTQVQNQARVEGEKIVSDAKSKAEQLLEDVNGLMMKIKKS